MLILGTHEVKGKRFETNETCPHCKEKNTVFIIVYRQYFHLFYIPTFPLDSDIVAICKACQWRYTLLRKKDLTDDIKSQVKIPIWYYTGIPLTILFFAGLIATII